MNASSRQNLGQPMGKYILANLILGTIGIFAEQLRMDAKIIVFYRCLFGAVAMGAFYLRIRSFQNIPARTWFLALFSGVLMTGNWLFFLEGLLRTSIGVATIIFEMQPFIVLIAGSWLYREALGVAKIFWLLVALSGLILASHLQAGSMNIDYAIGVICVLLSATFYAAGVLVGKSLNAIKPQTVTLIQCVVGGLILPMTAPKLFQTHISPSQWPWLAGLGVIHTALVYSMIQAALPRLRPSAIAILQFAYPASAILLDFIINGKLLSPAQIVGLVLIVLSTLGMTLGWTWKRSRKADVMSRSSRAIESPSAGEQAECHVANKEQINARSGAASVHAR
jgi:drug/metabolite transporter (DMT)-like permease